MNFYNYMNSIFKENIKEVNNKDFLNKLPIFIKESFVMKKICLFDVEFIAMEPNKHITLLNLVKNCELVKKNTNLDTILIFDNLSLRDRNYLISKKVDFVVVDLQIFILRLSILLNEKVKLNNLTNKDKFTPISQLIFSYIFINTEIDMLYESSKIRNDLELNKMSLKRGIENLVYHDLIELVKENGNTYIKRIATTQELIKKASKLFVYPVRREYYIYKEDVNDSWNLNLFSADSSLSQLSMLSSLEYDCFAVSKEQDSLIPDNVKMDKYYENMIKVHVFKYNPYLISDGTFIDFISLYAILKDNDDPRVQSELEKLKEKYYE